GTCVIQDFSLVVSAEEERRKSYSSGLQLSDSDKTLELLPEQTVYSSKLKVETEEGSVPVFLKHVSSVEVRQGDVARLSVVVTGSPKPKVEWFFGGVKLMSSTDYTFVFEGNDYSLIIPYARAADQGEYTCTASNSGKWEVGRGVGPFPPCFVKEPESAECARGLAAVFEYSVRGEPAPQVRWFRGNRQIFPSGSHTVLHHADGSGSLTVRECQGEDAGLYTCQAWSPLGEAACSAELRVVRDAPGAIVCPLHCSPLLLARLQCVTSACGAWTCN
uniref:Ig-like domain-containing protein n=1 Tax=Crocodylus porosus TaxID=8502 RepID=A0A7M4F6I8_CROPO